MVAKEDSILYDLLVHAEWPLEGEVLVSMNWPPMNALKNKSGFDLSHLRGSLPRKVLTVAGNSLWWIIQGIQNTFSGCSSISGLPAQLYRRISGHPNWHISLSSDGKLLAVLQDQCIEIRSVRDDFASVVAKCPVEKDPSPQWRKLSWSQDCSMLACSNSAGDVFVFDLAGELLFTIPQETVSLPSDLSQAIAGLVFIDHKHSAQWSAELLVVSYQGYLKNYLVSPTNGFQENHSFAFCNTLPGGLYTMLYHPQYSMLLIGCSAVQGTSNTASPSAFQSGLSAWRILSGFPYYKLIEEEGFAKNYGNSGILRKLSNMSLVRNRTSTQDGIAQFALSQDGTNLVALHHSGTLSLWEVPSLRNISIWDTDQQPPVEDHEAIAAFHGTEAKQSNKDNAFYGLVEANWWSQESLILAHSKGAVTVSSTKDSLTNLLGHSPESCEPWPCVTAAHNGGFLILECENNILVSRSRSLSSEDDEPDDSTEDDEDPTFMSKTKDFAKQAMFFLTESERFAPPLKRPKILNRTYRLVCIRSTTPEELYARKIELEEYGEALGLAETYDLDSDLVYQKQWRKSRVSVASIHDYLCKIKNRLWALNECVERVPDDYDAAKALLEYGLHGTDVHAIVAVGEGKVGSSFIVKGDYSEYDDAEERDEKKKKLENSLDFKRFNLEQRDICRYRLKLLQYQDRLMTYEVILGGIHLAYEEYDSEFFTRFRDVNIVQAAVEYAREGNWEALDAVFTYHGQETLPHRLAILSNFSETTSPREYRALLPEAGSSPDDPEVLGCYQKEWRKGDWAEKPQCKDVLEWHEEGDPGDFLYKENPDLQVYRCKLNGALLTQWYSSRASEIEKCSRQVDNALMLIKLGMERRVKGLEALHNNLETLEVLVYECCTDIHLGLQSFQDMTDLERLRMLLGKSTEESFVKDFKRWALPFLDRLEKTRRGTKTGLIHQYMADVAKVDLSCILKIFQHSTPERMEPVIPDTVQLMKLALECIYICKRTDQVDISFSILECLPAPEEDVLSEQVGELNKQVDRLEVQLCACEILAKHGLPKPVSFIVDTEVNPDEAKTIMVTLLRLASKRTPPIKEKAWKELLQDILSLQKQVYKCISIELCYQVYAETLLHSGRGECIALASKTLCKTSQEGTLPQPKDPLAGTRIGYEKSVELVLEAAREYFNSSNDLSDNVMDLARNCLNLIEDRPPSIQDEFNLIAALALLDDFGVSTLPLQVRLCEDKLGLIKNVLQSNTSAYNKTQKLLRLAALLQVSGTEEKTRKGRVLFLVAVAAFEAKDYSFSVTTCRTLIEDGYGPVWTVCRDIGSCENYKDYRARREMLSFALTHCTPDVIESLINVRSLLETQILYEEISQQLDQQELKEEETQSNGHIPVAPKTILAQVQDREWWKSTMKWIRPLRGPEDPTQITNGAHDNQTKTADEAFVRQEFHPFYRSLCDAKHYNVQVGFPYEKYQALQRQISSLYVSQCLLRTQKLSESRAEGTITEPASEVLLQLAESLLKFNMTDTLSCLLALPKPEEANEFFLQLSDSYLCLHLAAYYYSLEVYNMLLSPDIDIDQADVYHHPPDDVVKHVMGLLEKCDSSDWTEDVQTVVTCLLQYHNQMVDFAQAQLLQSLGRGVNIGRFAQDPEYKRETILGLAMAIEDEVFNTAMSLAERYQVPRWDMFMAHLEWLFTDTELPTKEIQERINKLDLMRTLLNEPAKMASTMHENIYPTIEGTKHARLIYYFMLLLDCQKAGAPVVETLDADLNLKLLKKIKPAAPGLDFKALTSGQSPADVLRPVLSAANVHVLSKMAAKIPSGEGKGCFLTSSSVFSVYAVKLFWDGEQKAADLDTEQQVDWNHRYEACHKLLPRLSASHVRHFVDAITFSEQASETLQLETRMDIVNRALKFARQQEAARRKRGTEETLGEGESSFADVIQYFEQSVRHLGSLNNELFFELVDFDQEYGTSFARKYDLSRSDPVIMCDILRELFLAGLPVESVQGFLQLAARQRPQNWRTVDVVQGTIRHILDSIRAEAILTQGKSPMDCLQTVVRSVSEHIQGGGGLVTQEDVLIPMRPFCEDVRVPVSDKTAVLELLELSFDLRGEDTFLLVYYQTDALVSANWNKKLSREEIDNDEKRHQLFLTLLQDSSAVPQLVALGSLLQIWPVLAATELSSDEPKTNPWAMLMSSLIRSHGNADEILKMTKIIRTTESLNEKSCQHLYELMLQCCTCLVALKFALIGKYRQLYDAAIDHMKTVEVSADTCDEELLALLVTRNLSAQVAHTPFLSALFDYVLANPNGAHDTSGQQSAESQEGARVKQVALQLQNAGLVSEAGTLMARYNGVHPALRTLDTALGALSRWLRR